MAPIRLKARVGPDGILSLTVPVGMDEANRDVDVIVEIANPIQPKPPMTQEQWSAFIARTAGAWQGEFERPDQGEYEVRDEWP